MGVFLLVGTLYGVGTRKIQTQVWLAEEVRTRYRGTWERVQFNE